MKKRDEGGMKRNVTGERSRGGEETKREKEIEKTEGTQKLIHLFTRLLVSMPHVSHCARPFPVGYLSNPTPFASHQGMDGAKLGFEAFEGRMEALAGMWQVRKHCVKEGFRASLVWWKVLWAIGRL